MSDIITPTDLTAINAAWRKLLATGNWSDQGRFPGGIIVRSVQGDIQRWSYEDILTHAAALAPAEIPDESRSHLGRLFIKDCVDPDSYADSQNIWRKVAADGKRGPQNIREVLTPAGVDWFTSARAIDLPLNKAGHVLAYRRLLKRDGMRAIAADGGDDLLILSLSDDGIIDMVRAGRSVEAYAKEHQLTDAQADERLGNLLEAAYDADQGDYGTTCTMCFAIPSGNRVTDCEMG